MPQITVVTPTIRPEGLEPIQKSLEAQTFTDFEWLVEMGIPGRGHDLNAAYNRMLRRSKGELIVFIQDHTKIPIDGLEKFWQAYENEQAFYTAPHGKADALNVHDNLVRWDWRMHKDGEISYNQWEIDWAAAPRNALFEIGGFDELLDQYWSCDNVNVAFRANLAGFQFYNLKDNPAVAWDHDKFIPHPFRANFKPEFNNARMEEFAMGCRINYLA